MTSPHIRIAQKAWTGGGGYAETREDAYAMVAIPWVEIDGRRYDSVIDARVEMAEGAARIALTLYGTAEIVLIGRDGTAL